MERREAMLGAHDAAGRRAPSGGSVRRGGRGGLGGLGALAALCSLACLAGIGGSGMELGEMNHVSYDAGANEWWDAVTPLAPSLLLATCVLARAAVPPPRGKRGWGFVGSDGINWEAGAGSGLYEWMWGLFGREVGWLARIPDQASLRGCLPVALFSIRQ